jgi:Superinfection immunity protein
MSEMIQVIFGLFILLALFVFYMIPTVVAVQRKHVNTASIAVVNFLLGWTLIGYAVALAWAFSAQETRA